MKIYLIIAGVITSLCVLFYFYYKDTQNTIKILTFNNAKLEQSLILSEESIKELQINNNKIRNTFTETDLKLSETRQQNRILVDKLGEHDLAYLAISKPKLVENIINKASNNVNRCFEILSGSSLTEKERNEKTLNSECSWVYKP